MIPVYSEQCFNEPGVCNAPSACSLPRGCVVTAILWRDKAWRTDTIRLDDSDPFKVQCLGLPGGQMPQRVVVRSRSDPNSRVGLDVLMLFEGHLDRMDMLEGTTRAGRSKRPHGPIAIFRDVAVDSECAGRLVSRERSRTEERRDGQKLRSYVEKAVGAARRFTP